MLLCNCNYTHTCSGTFKTIFGQEKYMYMLFYITNSSTLCTCLLEGHHHTNHRIHPFRLPCLFVLQSDHEA